MEDDGVAYKRLHSIVANTLNEVGKAELEHRFPSGSKLSAAGARQLGVSEERAQAWQSGSALPFKSTPPQYARKPYSSIYTNLSSRVPAC